MKARCDNPNNIAYKDYGERGITYSNDWDKFESFLSDMGPKPTKFHSIERLDVNGNYCKSNCIWATNEQQKRNKRNSRIIVFDGLTMTLTEHASRKGINSGTVWVRLFKLGWSVEDALNTPSKRNKR
ncbi:HNH endonuclease [Pantoea phage PdC23]|uniref:Uncharacterized protein n=1 Tax=Pantoea phage PdC23 TaxID=2894356 RepID=A0AAE9C8A1_9CAUD|nr:HNH endonuclease [Pantoea phage PdC23]UGC97776.1 hypothetical protein pdc_063 [Pantoea phage PdC23]